ncbi:sharpin [Eudromia elegans]
MAARTVLMAVRVSLAPPPAPGAALRLELSVERAPRRFLLALRHGEAGGGASIAEYDLERISYAVRSPMCHELSVLGSLDEPMQFSFEEEREARRWWTVVSSSLREARKASEGSGAPAAQEPALPGGAHEDPDEALVSELGRTEDLAMQLSEAIEFGDEEEASRCAAALARHQAVLRILLRESQYPTGEISMRVVVEDATSSATVVLRVHAHTTIAALKQQVFEEYGFHPLVQRWIIGQCLCADERTVASYGVRRHGDTAFLYLLLAKTVELSEQRYREEQARLVLSLARGGEAGAAGSGGSGRLDEGDISHQLDRLQITEPAGGQAGAAAAGLPSPVQPGWSCPTCTFINKPTRPGCEMCSTARPADYVVPDGYTPDETELWRMQQEQEGILQYQQALEAERTSNLQQLLQLEEEVLVPNRAPLECRICYQEVPAGAGVLLRECLHSFCRDCLRQVVNYSEEPEVACPFRDDSYACGGRLQEREIRALVSPEEHRRFLERGLALAERRSHGSFHCKTPDCRGWCICEEAPAEFRCPVCRALNCLRCKAIHEGRSCEQHQEELRARARDDAAAQQTTAMLQTLLQRGEAMRCPTCLIVVQKRDGCDWVRCTACQTEICWVTKGPRWGPAGPGDTSGGCRCNVNGQRCHPQCQNCH